MIIKASLLSLPFALLIGAAAAQTPSWPIVNGRQLQPTQQQIESSENIAGRQRERDARSEVERLFNELTRDTSARKR